MRSDTRGRVVTGKLVTDADGITREVGAPKKVRLVPNSGASERGPNVPWTYEEDCLAVYAARFPHETTRCYRACNPKRSEGSFRFGILHAFAHKGENGSTIKQQQARFFSETDPAGFKKFVQAHLVRVFRETGR